MVFRNSGRATPPVRQFAGTAEAPTLRSDLGRYDLLTLAMVGAGVIGSVILAVGANVRWALPALGLLLGWACRPGSWPRRSIRRSAGSAPGCPWHWRSPSWPSWWAAWP